MPRVGHGDKLLAVESTFTSSVDAVSFRLFNTFALTLFDKPPFQLSHHAENGHDDPAGFASRRHVWIEHSDECLPLIALMHNVEHIAGIAPQPVEAGNDKFVAWPQEFDDRHQLGAAFAAAA
jgi:hypothetical protein